MQPPRISIVIPVYNASSHLRRGLGSLQAQTNGMWEAVCIDDGSSDDSLAILQAYAARDTRFRVLSQMNSGVSVARNRGIREARGEWVTFLDADDWLSMDLIERLLSCPCPEQVDIIGFEAEAEYEKGVGHDAQLDEVFLLKQEGEHRVTPKTLDDMVGTCWGKAYRRSFLLDKGLEFPVGMRLEDEVFYRCCMGVARSVYLMKHVGYHYLQTANSYMHQHTDPRESYLLYLKGAHLVHAYYQMHGKTEEWTRTLLTFLYKRLAGSVNELSRRQINELRQQTGDFLEKTRYAGLEPEDYRVRFFAILPWWKDLLSHRGWHEESFKFCGIAYRIDYYRDYKLVRRNTVWSKLREIFMHGHGNNML